MSVLEKLTGPKPAKPEGVPKDVKERVDRGRVAMMKDASKRRVNFKFYRGEQYCWVNDKSLISWLPTITYTNGRGKEPHRVRTTRNMAKGLIEAKVSQASNAMPGYEVNPTSTDPSAASAAKTAQKVATYGYDKWGLRKARVKWITNALVADGGYMMPYFDPNVGPFVPDPEDPSKHVGYGEVKILVLNGSQVAWEPGVDFEDSPWHAIIRARPLGEVQKTPGFTGNLKADASTLEAPTDRPTDEMVLTVEYFERPTPERPRGRKITMANDLVIGRTEDYPLVDSNGDVCDEPVLHQLTYTLDPDADRDMGLMEHLLDAQRTLNDCVSKAIEWKNRCLVPQIVAKKGSLDRNAQVDDSPGRIHWLKNVNGSVSDNFKWQDTPPIPRELFEMADQAIQHMQAIAADPDVSNSSAAPGTLAQIAQQAQQRWTTFLAELAEQDSRVMRHALYLVSRYYTEPRLLELKGRWDWDNIQDFKGADLLGQCSVRVDKTSLQARTRQEVKEDIQFWQTNYPGAVPVEAAMAAYYGGVAENMILDYRLDIAKANEIIRALRAGPETLFAMQPQIRTRIDDTTGQMTMEEVPWWMPGPSDNVRVWKQLIGSWMKTTEFTELEPGMKAAADEIYNGLLSLEMQEAARQQAMQTQTAQQLGMANAAAPQGSALPSVPAVANQAGGTGSSNGNNQGAG